MDEIEPTPVGKFVQALRTRLRSDDRNQHCLLRGEISQWKPYASGHTYFSLRDDGGQISAVIWKGRCRIPDGIKDGQEVLIIGNVDLYPARGQLQIVVERIELIQKIGALEQQKQKLLLQLRQEGVLDRPRKSLPALPKHLVIVTGKNSAALADMLQLSQSRWPGIRTTVIGVTVQGESLRGTEVQPASGTGSQIKTVSVASGGTGGTPGTFTHVHANATSGSGVAASAVFNVTTDGSSTPSVTVYHGGTGFGTSQTVTIPGSSLGSSSDLVLEKLLFSLRNLIISRWLLPNAAIQSLKYRFISSFL